jgi:glycosyltransferase involved in cell wall biosynthesis
MKILILSENEYSCGASIAAHRFAQGLVQSGHEVVYVFNQPSPASIPDSGIQKIALQQGYHFSKFRQGLHHLPGIARQSFRQRFQKNLKELRALIASERPDIINAHNVNRMLSHGDILELLEYAPVVWTMHDNFALQGYHYRFPLLDGKEKVTHSLPLGVVDPAEVDAVRQSEIRFVTCSAWLRQHNLNLLGPLPNLFHIPNGINPEEFFPDGNKETTPTLLFLAANLDDPRKNLATFLDAIEDMPIENAQLLAVGKSSPGLEQRASHIQFLSPGFHPEKLRKIYSKATLHIIPSLIDNLPNTVLESLFCGTPVLAANTGGAAEMIEPGVTGLAFNPYDRKELRSQLDLLLAGIREGSIQTGADCHHITAKHYSLTLMVDRYVALFEQLL